MRALGAEIEQDDDLAQKEKDQGQCADVTQPRPPAGQDTEGDHQKQGGCAMEIPSCPGLVESHGGIERKEAHPPPGRDKEADARQPHPDQQIAVG